MWFRKVRWGPVVAPTVLAQPPEDVESKQGGTEKQRQKESTGKVVVPTIAGTHDPNLVAKYAGGSLRESGCVPCNQCVAEMDRAGGVCCSKVPEQLAARAARVRGNLG